ncbi:hypothetical protein DFP72DRAFT_882303 [Ephemerocybe angulata]|uniref:Uncharacterized protein n=1 Tax=Ephemerocybe angulata TaxID=980116 RepID=A0A8H6I7W6_9AGAR|nr:hypothetical protein DFP72DRAFT_882303 [Tulosesus angulatus]
MWLPAWILLGLVPLINHVFGLWWHRSSSCLHLYVTLSFCSAWTNNLVCVVMRSVHIRRPFQSHEIVLGVTKSDEP